MYSYLHLCTYHTLMYISVCFCTLPCFQTFLYISVCFCTLPYISLHSNKCPCIFACFCTLPYISIHSIQFYTLMYIMYIYIHLFTFLYLSVNFCIFLYTSLSGRSVPFILAPARGFGWPPSLPCEPLAHDNQQYSFPWSFYGGSVFEFFRSDVCSRS